VTAPTRVTLVLVAALLAAAPAAAQLGPPGAGAGSPGTGMARDSHIQRELRSIEGRSVTQPGPAARDAGDARRVLLRSGQGTALDPEALRAERRLEGVIGDEAARRGAAAPGTVDRPTPDLPASYDQDRDYLPRPAPSGLAPMLLDRAEEGLVAGRTDQARSDLAIAEREIDGLSVRLGARDPEVVTLRARATDLRQKLR
jgi:hypothetical protein